MCHVSQLRIDRSGLPRPAKRVPTGPHIHFSIIGIHPRLTRVHTAVSPTRTVEHPAKGIKSALQHSNPVKVQPVKKAMQFKVSPQEKSSESRLACLSLLSSLPPCWTPVSQWQTSH